MLRVIKFYVKNKQKKSTYQRIGAKIYKGEIEEKYSTAVQRNERIMYFYFILVKQFAEIIV